MGSNNHIWQRAISTAHELFAHCVICGLLLCGIWFIEFMIHWLWGPDGKAIMGDFTMEQLFTIFDTLVVVIVLLNVVAKIWKIQWEKIE